MRTCDDHHKTEVAVHSQHIEIVFRRALMKKLKPGQSSLNILPTGGAPTKLTPKVMDAIVSSVRAGNYAGTAAKAAGISRAALSAWRQKADNGIEPYATLYERVSQAASEAEDESVAELRSNQDWRAKAWWLEHGPAREAWSAGTGSSATDSAVTLLELLRLSASKALNTGESAQPYTAEDEQPQD